MNIDLSKVIIRKVAHEDIDIMTSYRLNYLTELQGERNEKYKQDLRNELEHYFRKSLSEGSYFAYMAEFENRAIAFGGMVIKNIPGDFNKASYREGDILNMYTIPEARRKGISTLILKELLNEAKNSGISKVALHTSKDGEMLYRKFGFSDPVYPVLEINITGNE